MAFKATKILQFLLTLFLFVVTSSYAAPGKSFSVTSNSGTSYELAFLSESIELMKPMPVLLTVKNQEGMPVTGARINCSLTMPAMAMPTNRPPVKESMTAGQYEGLFLLTMGGLWNAEFIVTLESGGKDSVVIPIPGVSSGESDGSQVNSQLEELFQQGKNSE
jgi:hypothetical protein